MDEFIENTVEEVWQKAVAVIEKNLSRAHRNTWLRPARFLTFSEETWVIGCLNKFGRDWLTQHLTDPLQQSLSRLTGAQTRVRFVLLGQEGEEEAPPGDRENGDRSGSGIELSVRYGSAREAILQPERVVRLPVYFLRWLPYVGAQIVFLAAALWQEHYLSGDHSPQAGSSSVSVRVERICQWAGISRAQFFRLQKKDARLGWFAGKKDTAHEVDRRSGKVKKSANRYQLFDAGLTPGDLHDLKIFLISHGIQESPQQALECALGVEPKEILRYPAGVKMEGFETLKPCSQTVQGLVQELTGTRIEVEVAQLADRLSDRLTRPGEFVMVSWYFLRNWLPVLGAEAGMFVLLLRSLCYFNEETGELRDEVCLEGGCTAIARRLGISNPRMVAHWFAPGDRQGRNARVWSSSTAREVERRKRVQDTIALFTRRIERHSAPHGTASWRFKVQRCDPLTPQHQALLNTAAGITAKAESLGVLDELHAWIERRGSAPIVLRRTDPAQDCSETLAGVLTDCLETLALAPDDCSETLLKILKVFKDTFQKKETPTVLEPSNREAKSASLLAAEIGVDGSGYWSLEKLLYRAERSVRRRVLAQEKSALPFVSWVIHGASHPGIQDPYGLAIHRLLTRPGVGAGGASLRLASRRPADLVCLIAQAARFGRPEDPDWRGLFGEQSLVRVRLLADCLGLDRVLTAAPDNSAYSNK